MSWALALGVHAARHMTALPAVHSTTVQARGEGQTGIWMQLGRLLHRYTARYCQSCLWDALSPIKAHMNSQFLCQVEEIRVTGNEGECGYNTQIVPARSSVFWTGSGSFALAPPQTRWEQTVRILVQRVRWSSMHPPVPHLPV